MKINDNSLSIQNGHLFIEGCDTVQLAKQYGTPLFVVSENHLRKNLRRYKNTFEKYWTEGEVRIMPSIKASPILAIRQILTDEGCGCDVFGPGEFEGALRGGVEPDLISLNGSIKDRDLIRRAIEMGARIVLDSPQDLTLCEQEARKLGKVAQVMFRIKPFMKELETSSDFVPDMLIRELTQIIKYGIPTSELLPMGPRAMHSRHINPIGIHVHMGRHSKKLDVWRSWVRHSVLITKRLSDLMEGWTPSVIDFGGGFPSFPDRDPDVYVQDDEGENLDAIAQVITATLRDTMAEVNINCSGLIIEVEPGRGLHCDTGIHITTIKNTKEEKENRPRKWAEFDTSEVFLGIPGINEKPPFDFIFANKAEQPKTIITDLVGMTCNAEILFMQIDAPILVEGDIVALLNTGSYIEPMAANFNALPRPGTVLVTGAISEIVKRRETVDDVFARDIIPKRLLPTKTK